MEPVRWGILGTAKIAVEKVIPAMQKGTATRVVAIASRNAARARDTAIRLGIGIVHDSYEALLTDPAIEAVYNPLPNHLHVPGSIRAMEAGKHVLCEKPVALTVAEANQLVQAEMRTGRRVAEAFMVLHHPQWQRARILAEPAAVHRPGEPGPKRQAKGVDRGGREGEQAGPVVRAFEGEDPRLARRKQGGAKRDLDRVLPRHPELRRPGQALAEVHGHLSVGQIAERVHDRLSAPGLEDLRIPVPERGNPEAAGEIEVLPAVGVDDTTALGLSPDQAEPLRRGTSRPRVSAAM